MTNGQAWGHAWVADGVFLPSATDRVLPPLPSAKVSRCLWDFDREMCTRECLLTAKSGHSATTRVPLYWWTRDITE